MGKNLTSSTLSRRDFLKLGVASLAGLGFRDFPPGGDPALKRQNAQLGRTVYSMRYYESPTVESAERGYYITDSVVNIHEKVAGDPRPTRNPIWLRTDEGWLHSAYVQPVQNTLNKPVLDIPGNNGLLMEVTVPFTQAYTITERGWRRVYRCYYGSAYWILHEFTNNDGTTWYQFWDDRSKEQYIFQADHLRPVPPEELTQISPGVQNKRIEIDLENQRMTAYEASRPVFVARTATGYFEGDTPRGEFVVERKQPTRHMASTSPGNEFDLPGVPWVCYIAWTGVSFHGTYWHNNYGFPQSHGCINLTPQAAKWIYRWTDPFVPFGEDYVEADGTPVFVY